MYETNRFAFKEWAAICRAVATGRQTVLIRKGGIHERRGRFAVEHDEFWLFPTRFHQEESELTEEGRQCLIDARNQQAEPGLLRLSEYVVVTDVFQIEREETLPSIRPFHVYADDVLGTRFHYKRPGLTLVIVRAGVLTKPLHLADSPHFAGCRSWIDLPSELSTAGVQAVLDDATFELRRAAIRRELERTATG